jgi:hypothetical protein
MFNEIPKIRWRLVTANGDSAIGSNTITLMTSTADLRVGMKVNHASFPVGTTITAILSANSIQLSNNATLAVSVSRDYFFEFEFRYPPRDDDGESRKVKERKSVSISGVRQISLDHTEISRPMTFSFLTKDEIDDLRFFFSDWAEIGKEFQYFENKNSVTFILYEMEDLDFQPKKVTPVLYSLNFKVRRVE